jgi:hypothetical protein
MQHKYLGGGTAKFFYVCFLGSADRLYCFRDVQLCWLSSLSTQLYANILEVTRCPMLGEVSQTRFAIIRLH